MKYEIKVAFEIISAALEITFNFHPNVKQGSCWSDIRTIHKACYVFRIFRVRTSTLKLPPFLSLVGCKKQLSERNKEEGDGFVTDYSPFHV